MEFLAQRKARKALKALGKAVTMCRSARLERKAHRAIFDTHLRGGRRDDATRNAVEGHMLAWLQLATPAARTGALLHLVDLLKYRGASCAAVVGPSRWVLVVRRFVARFEC